MLTLDYGSDSQRITCPHRDGVVPSQAINVVILDAGGSELLSSTAATKGTLDTTLSSAASAGSKSIAVADATGAVIGAPIILTDAAGRTETAEIEGVDGTTIYLVSRLSRDYASSDDVDTAHIYYDADISDTDDFGKDVYYQAIFSSTGWEESRGVLFRVVDLVPSNPIRFEDVRRWVQNLDEIRDSHDKPLVDDARDNAWELIKTKLTAMGRDPEVWRSVDEVRLTGGLLAGGLFLLAHGNYEQARHLIGDPPGMGGLFSWHWQDFGATPQWYDENQDRSLDSGEKRRPVSNRLRRGL